MDLFAHTIVVSRLAGHTVAASQLAARSQRCARMDARGTLRRVPVPRAPSNQTQLAVPYPSSIHLLDHMTQTPHIESAQLFACPESINRSFKYIL